MQCVRSTGESSSRVQVFIEFVRRAEKEARMFRKMSMQASIHDWLSDLFIKTTSMRGLENDESFGTEVDDWRKRGYRPIHIGS